MNRPGEDINTHGFPSESDRESMELLQAEVEQLQLELAERDAQLAELSDCRGTDTDEYERSDDALLSRLEDLLSELERNDERGAMLEQLLQVAEEKNRADQEERRHLAAWIDDIEQRLGDREADWVAERDALTHRVQTVVAERDELMAQLRDYCGQGAEERKSPSREDQIQSINLELRQQLHEAQECCNRLEQEVRDRDQRLATRSDAETALREEHLKLSQDRATLARQQAELATAQARLERAPNRPETEIDCRLREFREHLREIHSEEQQLPEKMSSRLSRLWARIEGR